MDLDAVDPDIGLCDDCGSDEGDRKATNVTATMNGERRVVTVWLCSECEPLRG